MLGVNITDDHSDTSAHQVEIEYVFSWPGGGELESIPGASRRNSSFCFIAPISWGTAKNITDKYTDANTDSTDCTPVLGSACVDAILTGSAEKDDGSYQGCWDRPWSEYPECADTFGIAEYAPYQGEGLTLETNSLEPGYTSSRRHFHSIIERGGVSSSGASLPGLYENATNMLQVVLLRPPVARTGEAFSPTLNCMRVNTKEVVDVGSGGSEGNSGASRDVAAAGLWAVMGFMGSLAVALL